MFGLCFMLAIATLPMFAYADIASTLFSRIIGTVGTFFQFIGSFLFIASLGSLFMAFKNDDPDSKSKSGTAILISICMIGVPGIYKMVVAAAGGGEDAPIEMGDPLIGGN